MSASCAPPRVAQSYREIGFPPPVAEQASAAIRPFIARAAARKAEFHGPLTRPDGAQLAEIAALIDTGAIRASVSAAYGFDQLAAAYEILASGHTRGKLVIVP